jgi:hypothetical protein
VNYGADEIFKVGSTDVQDEDIELLIKRGLDKAETMQKRAENVIKDKFNMLDFQVNTVNMYQFEDVDYLQEKRKEQEKALKKNLGTLSKNIYKLFSDKHKLEGGWLKVQTGRMSKHEDSSPKTTKRTMVKILDLLPDEAIFKVIWGEEESRIKFDKIIRDSAVDDLLFKDFLTAKSSPLHFLSQLREKFESASQQSFDDLLPIIGNTFEKCPCRICGNTRSARLSSSSVVGVKCEEDHFVCSTCYLSFYTKDTSVLSIKDAQQHHRQSCNKYAGERI